MCIRDRHSRRRGLLISLFIVEEQRNFFKIDDVAAVGGVALGQHGGTGEHLTAGLPHQLFNGLDAAAGGDDVIDDGDLRCV